jgi:hypothetical protein
MKKLFCVSVIDSNNVYGLESPIIFHIKCEDSNQAKDAVREMLEEEYEFEPEWIDGLEIFTCELTDANIVEI